jgi:hypothetical protein
VVSALPWKRALSKAPCPVFILFSPARHCCCVWFLRAHSLSNELLNAPAIIPYQTHRYPNSDPQHPAQQILAAEGSASVAGTVLDVSGATVSGADVGLMHTDGTQMNTMVSEADGEFNFTKIPAGSYLVTVNAKGFAFFTSAEFAVAVRQAYEVTDVSLSIARASIEVRPTEMIALSR